MNKSVDSRPRVIEPRALRKSFGKKPVLQGVEMIVPAGQTFAFLGRNGAGKTATIRTLLGSSNPMVGKFASWASIRTRPASKSAAGSAMLPRIPSSSAGCASSN